MPYLPIYECVDAVMLDIIVLFVLLCRLPLLGRKTLVKDSCRIHQFAIISMSVCFRSFFINLEPCTWQIVLSWTHVHLQLLLFMSLCLSHTHTRPVVSRYPVFQSPVTLSSWYSLSDSPWFVWVSVVTAQRPASRDPGPVSSLWILKPEMDGPEQPLPRAVCAARPSCSPPPSKQILLSAARRATFAAELF